MHSNSTIVAVACFARNLAIYGSIQLLIVISMLDCAMADSPTTGEPQSAIIRADIDNGTILFSVSPEAFGRIFVVQMNGIGRTLYSFRKRNDEIQLSQPVLRNTFGHRYPVAARHFPQVRRNALPVVISSFEIQGERDGWVTFDATRLFRGEVQGFPSLSPLVKSGADELHELRASEFSEGIEVWGIQVYKNSDRAEYESTPRYSGSRLDVKTHWTIRFLDEELLEPRALDPRVGFGSANEARIRAPFGNLDPIRRWRLEKREPGVQSSEPKEPIVVYLSAEIPDIWRPWIRDGILAWNKAFERIGLENAIVVEDEPTDDPTFYLESGRYNVVEWLPPRRSEVTFASVSMPVGGGITSSYDLRSGEILNARIPISWPADLFLIYFAVACGPALGDGLGTKDIVERIAPYYLSSLVAHEFGHALGLRDGNFGEGVYLSANLRDEEWLKEYGFSPSVMAYSRCNYAAQPEDQIDAAYLVPRVGPADIHQIEWGYASFPEAHTADAEKSALEAILAKQNERPWLRFASLEGDKGPGTFNNAIDVKDVVEGSRLGLKNVYRSLSRLEREVEHSVFTDAEAVLLYYASLDVWATIVEHATSVIGGVEIFNRGIHNPGDVIIPVDLDRARASVDFVLDTLVQADDRLTLPVLDRRIGPKHGRDFREVLKAQMITSLLDPYRLNRLAEFEEASLAGGFLSEYLDDIVKTFFPEVAERKGDIPEQNQALRKVILEKLDSIVKGEGAQYLSDGRISYWRPAIPGRGEVATEAVKSLVRGKREHLCSHIAKHAARTRSDISRGHFLQLKDLCQ